MRLCMAPTPICQRSYRVEFEFADAKAATAATVKPDDVTLAPEHEALSEYVPTALRARLLKEAKPPCSVTVVVPSKCDPAGFDLRATVTTDLLLVQIL